MRTLIGGVGYRWQQDASIGLVASDALAELDWPPGVEVADLGYGAIYVTQDLADAQPPYKRLILLSGVTRGRETGRIYRYRWSGTPADPQEVQDRIQEAGAGVIDLDHLLVIAHYFGALPEKVTVFEVEPLISDGGDVFSPPVAALLPELIERVRLEALSEGTIGDRRLNIGQQGGTE